MHKALKGKNAPPETMSNDDNDDLLEKALAQILLLLSDGVLRKVANKKTITRKSILEIKDCLEHKGNENASNSGDVVGVAVDVAENSSDGIEVLSIIVVS